MRNKHFYRAVDLVIPETEARMVERMAERGYAPCSMTTRRITFRPVKPEKLKAKIVVSGVGQAGYLKLANRMHQQGWEYVCNDGVSSSIFVCSNQNSPEPELNEGELETAKKRFTTKLIFTILYAVVFLLIFLSNGMGDANTLNFVEIFEAVSLPKRLLFLAMADFLLLEFTAMFGALRNKLVLEGRCMPRRSAFGYIVNIALVVLFVLLLAVCAVTAIVGMIG